MPRPLLWGGGPKKGHNLVKILLIISNFELDLYFIILYYTEQSENATAELFAIYIQNYANQECK